MREHIIIGGDRCVIVPESLQKIGVQFDHNATIVTFDCPRYWDGHDLSKMAIYINYMRPNDTFGTHVCDMATVDPSNNTIMHFDWMISGHATEFAGSLLFLVCIKDVDSDGNVATYWNSELNSQLYISSGMKCRETVINRYPDIITQLLRRMNVVEDTANGVAANAKIAADAADTVTILSTSVTNSVTNVSGMANSAANSALTAQSYANAVAKSARQVTDLVEEVSGMVEASSLSATNAATSATKAKTSEDNAETSATNAANSATNAAASAINAETSASNAAASAINAETSASNASTSVEYSRRNADSALKSATNAETSATNAANSEAAAATSATNAANRADYANTRANDASNFANDASDYALWSKSWAVGNAFLRDDESTNNAKYWCLQAKSIVGGDYMTVEEFENANIDCGNW